MEKEFNKMQSAQFKMLEEETNPGFRELIEALVHISTEEEMQAMMQEYEDDGFGDYNYDVDFSSIASELIFVDEVHLKQMFGWYGRTDSIYITEDGSGYLFVQH